MIDWDFFNRESAPPPKIVRCLVTGCGSSAPELVRDGNISPYALAVDEDRVYYTNVDHGTVVSIPK
jgi:hypothetical protein